MAKTINRQPFSVPVRRDRSAYLTQVKFKGLCDNRNDIDIDPNTFADINNLYVNDNDVLTSRPPIKLDTEYEENRYIIQQWLFGEFGLRLFRKYDEMTNMFTFTIKCPTKETYTDAELGRYAEYEWVIDKGDFAWNYEPHVSCIPVEDKIFVWFAGVDLIVFNTAGSLVDGVRKYYFESAEKYLYVPINKLVINGLESEVETKNFLTDSYKKRYQYSALSSVDFSEFTGREVDVSSAGNKLYTINGKRGMQKMLIAPQSIVGNDDFYVDMVITPAATVFMRFNRRTKSIEVSFDGKFFKMLPDRTDETELLGEPMLSKDGLNVIAFTRAAINICTLAKSTTEATDQTFTWSTMKYARRMPEVAREIVGIPRGHFDDIDNYSIRFCYKETRNNSLHEVIYNESGLYEDKDATFIDRTVAAEVVNSDCLIARTPVRSTVDAAAARTIGNYVAIAVGLHIEWFKFSIKYDTSLTTKTEAIGKWTLSNMLINGTSTNINSYGVNLRAGALDIYYKPTAKQVDIRINFAILAIVRAAVNYKTYDLQAFVDIEADFDKEHTDKWKAKAIGIGDYDSRWYKVSGDNVLTENYSWTPEDIIVRPTTEALAKITKDKTLDSQMLLNIDPDYLPIGFLKLPTIAQYKSKIHKLTPDGLSLSDEPLKSGDMVSFVIDGVTEYDFLQRNLISFHNNVTTAEYNVSNRYIIEKIAAYTHDGNYDILDGLITAGDLIRLTSVDKEITLPVGHPGNNTDIPLKITPNLYSDYTASAEGWFDENPTYPPPDYDVGELLPAGPIKLYGTAQIERDVHPLYVTDQYVWYLVDGQLWTSKPSSDTIIDIDDYINTEVINGVRHIDVNYSVPYAHSLLHEHYGAFREEDTGLNLLEVSETRRDEDIIKLYLPKRNEQIFTQPITNLHPLSEESMGIFTANDIWYITTVRLSNGSIAYTKPVKSKLPLGCRDGDEIVTALDGRQIIFATQRGIAALAPQDFVATTEQTLTYLSDNIQDTYYHFYNDVVKSASMLQKIDGKEDTFGTGYAPQIKIATYRYWIIFYKYMTNEMLALDTRNGSWWRWTTPYPIKSLSVGVRLYLLMQIDFTSMYNELNDKTYPLMGVSFLWSDKEVYLDSLDYNDDLIPNAISGETAWKYYNSFVGGEFIYLYPSSRIKWYATSQKLHFGYPNNYKHIRALNLCVKGSKFNNIKLATTVYRDLYHPSDSTVVEIKVNELRTFIQRYNLMHVIDFQYKIENDDTNDVAQQQLQMDSLSIKYEVKEMLR